MKENETAVENTGLLSVGKIMMDFSLTEGKFESEIDLFDKLEKEVIEETQHYAKIVVTPDIISEIKTKVASYRKEMKNISDNRIAFERKWMMPVKELYTPKSKHLIDIYQSAVNNMDGQVKEYEENAKNLRMVEIKNAWESFENTTVDFSRVFDPKWLNSTTTDKQWRSALQTLMERIQNDITFLQSDENPAFVRLSMENYAETLDTTQALTFAKRKLEEAKRIIEQSRVVPVEVAPKIEDVSDLFKLNEVSNVSYGIEKTADPYQSEVGMAFTIVLSNMSDYAKACRLLSENGIEFK